MAGKSNKVFTEVRTYQELQCAITDNIHYLTNGYFNNNGLNYAVASLNNLSEDYKKQAIAFAHYVDRHLSIPGASNGNYYHKLPTVLAGCAYLSYFPEQTQRLSLAELSLLARFSIDKQPTFYETAIDYIGKDLLKAITDKHFDYAYQTGFLALAESKLQNGELSADVAEYIKNSPLESLKEATFALASQQIQEVGKYI